MQKYWFVVIILFLLSSIVIAEGNSTDLIWVLHNHKDPAARENAAVMIGTLKIKSAVKPLIDALDDENEKVRVASYESLIKITKQNIALKQEEWLNWWKQSGQQSYENISSVSGELSKLKSYFNIALIVIFLGLVFIILFIVVFSFMGGAKIKEMKEINRRADRYIVDAEGISKRFEELFEEIEKKREDLKSYFNNLREDNQNELERFADLIQQNIEHSLREASRGLREKSEAELRQTLTLLKEDLEHLVKKTIVEQLKQDKQRD
jgi:F0F1-type ATP synthase membrane subunit b/b'